MLTVKEQQELAKLQRLVNLGSKLPTHHQFSRLSQLLRKRDAK